MGRGGQWPRRLIEPIPRKWRERRRFQRSFAEKIEVVMNNLGFEGILSSMGLDLKKEGFGQSSGSNSCGMKGLNQSQGLFDLGGGGVG